MMNNNNIGVLFLFYNFSINWQATVLGG